MIKPLVKQDGTPARCRMTMKESKRGPMVNVRFTVGKNVIVAEQQGVQVVTPAPAPINQFTMGLN